jgi:hypothetical protein
MIINDLFNNKKTAIAEAESSIDAVNDKPMRWDVARATMVPVDEPAKSTLNPADALGPGEEVVPPTFSGPSDNTVTRSLNTNTATNTNTNSNSKFVLWDPNTGKPMTPADKKRYDKAAAKSAGKANDSAWPPGNWRAWDQKNQTLRPAGQKQSFDSPSIPAKPRPGSWQELARLNNITDPRKLQAGTYIKTPDGGSIYVNKGDTLSGLAQYMRDTGTGNQRIKEVELPPNLTRDEMRQQMLTTPNFGGPNAPGFKHTVQGAEGEEYNFDSEQEARDFVDRIEQLRLMDRERGGLGAAKSESASAKKKGMAEGNPMPGQDWTDREGNIYKYNPATKGWSAQQPIKSDGFDVVSNYADQRTTQKGDKYNSTYTSTSIQKNPTTGQQQSLARWDHTDPATGKYYSGSNYIDRDGNAYTQKNYNESQDQLDELDKKTVASWVRQQPKRIKGDSGLSRTDFKKAKRLVDKSIPSALSKIKDPGYGKQEPQLDEVSLGKYREKAQLSQAGAKMNKFFGRDDPAAVAAADQTIAKREKGLARADARIKSYTASPVDQDKQRRDLADKYPNIDELVRQAELRRDPDYEYADGPAYYDGRDAEHNYHRLKQIQRMIRGAELDEMDFGGLSQTTDSDTGDVTTNFNQGPLSVSQTKTPGGYTKQTDRKFTLGPATIAQKTVGPNLSTGQLAGTTTKTATNNMTGQSQQQVKGVGFGGASGATVGKNYVGSSDDELARHAADSLMGTNESVDRMKHLAGIKPAR